MKQIYKYIISAIIGALVVLLLLKGCNGSKDFKTAHPDKITIDTVYKIKESNIFIKDKNPSIKYLYRNKTIHDTTYYPIDTMSYWKYTIDTTYIQKKGKIQFKANGFGYIENIDITTTMKDSTVYITKEITKYKEDTRSHLFIGPSYNTQKDIGIGLDWMIRNKAIISTSIQYNDITKQPAAGVGIKFRFK